MVAEAAARFPLVDVANADPAARGVFGEIERELGFGMVPNIFRAMAVQPAILRATWDLFRATILQGELPRVVKEMIGVVVSATNGSEYALKVHLHSLAVQGVAEITLAALAEGSDTARDLPPSVAAIIALAHKAARLGPRAIEQADIDALEAEGIGARELSEIFAAIDLFQYINGFTDLARVPIDAL